jgi:lysophospholipase L1-like esterase
VSSRLLVAAASVAVLAADVLLIEGLLAARREYLPAESAPAVDGEWGDPADRDCRLVLVGDSTAAGVGTSQVGDTVGGQLAALLAGRGRHVLLSGVGVAGSRAGDLGPQVSRALLGRPDVAVVLVGANDATTLTIGRRMTGPLASACGRLAAEGIPVVLGSCPDLGAARAFLHPLREIHAAVGRLVARRQAAAVAESGTIVVDLAAATGPAFRSDPGTLAADRFHPSPRGYALWADALLPAVEFAAGGRLAGAPTSE